MNRADRTAPASSNWASRQAGLLNSVAKGMGTATNGIGPGKHDDAFRGKSGR